MALKLRVKAGHRVGIGDGIVVKVKEIKAGRVLLEITAPDEDVILREALLARAEADTSTCTGEESP